MNKIYKFCERRIFLILAIAYILIIGLFWLTSPVTWSIAVMLIIVLLCFVHLAHDEHHNRGPLS